VEKDSRAASSRYDAFISYSHALDGALVPTLQSPTCDIEEFGGDRPDMGVEVVLGVVETAGEVDLPDPFEWRSTR
jgi:hypothetical protein